MLNDFIQTSEGKKVLKWFMITILLLSTFLAVQVLIGLKKFRYIGRDIYPQTTITVSGEGEAFALPDIATFSFSVVEVGETVAEAQEKVQTKIAKALSSLEDSDVEEKDIKTTNYSFYPKYEWNRIVCITLPCPSGKNILIGYEVNQRITVKVREIDQAGDLVTKIGSLGATNVSGVNFEVDDREKYVSQAREEAIKEAKEKAKKLAKELDVKLVKIIFFNELGNNGPRYGYDGLNSVAEGISALSVVADLPAGETKITSKVNITYEIR